jgi:5S rRNA maturation endonuclease (ribonuclease M5)
MTTKVERNKKDEVVITISGAKDAESLQRLMNYVQYMLATEGSKARQADVDKLAREVNAGWWKKNKKRYLGEGRR